MKPHFAATRGGAARDVRSFAEFEKIDELAARRKPS